MPTCTMCGGNISAHDTTCPFCGNDLVPAPAADPGMGFDWDLLTDDANPAPPAPPPAAAPAPGAWEGFEDAPAPGGQEDWLLSADELTSLPPTPMPIPQPMPPSQPGWAPLPQNELSLPAWEPVAPEAPSSPPGNDVDFVFDLDPPTAEPPPVAPPPPAPMPPPNVAPAWQVSQPPPPTPIAVPPPASVRAAPPPPPVFTPPAPAVHPAGPRRVCPSCGKTYEADYRDEFCGCGAELVAARAVPPPSPPTPLLPPKPAPLPAHSSERPPAGTRCLVLYGADKKPIQYFPLTKDATLIGRLDPVSGCFPEIDVSEWVDDATARKVSRKHALLLHVRGSDNFILRPLPGNTGTQVNAAMCPGGDDVPLAAGARVILGGAVRFKFEIA